MDLIKPNRLRAGDCVYIAAPAGPPNPELVRRGVLFLEGLNLCPVVSPHLFARHGYLAGTDEIRADDFNQALMNPDYRAIFCARGGYGSPRLLDLINYDAIRSDPKIIVGFSDITALLLAIFSQTGVVVFHGPILAGNQLTPYSRESLVKQLFGFKTHLKWPGQLTTLLAPSNLASINQGTVMGGCLSLLSILCGTRYQPNVEKSIVFIEEIHEAPYRLDRLLNHLRLCGFFKNVKALLMGAFVDCDQKDEDKEPTLSFIDILFDLFGSTSIPVYHFPHIGHIPDTLTVPIGIPISLESNSIIQTESGVG